MDHVWQIGHIGPPEHEMLEAYTTLGYLAARTSKIHLLAWVTEPLEILGERVIPVIASFQPGGKSAPSKT